MRKFTFSFKSLLIAAGLLMGSASAWADNIAATLYHTGSSSCTTAKEYYQTLDAAGEVFKLNRFGGNGNCGAAYVHFKFDIPEGHSVTGATLTWTAKQNTSSNRAVEVYYVNDPTSIDYSTDGLGMDAESTNRYGFNYSGTLITNTPSITKDNAITTINTDVTDAVQAMIENDYSEIAFKFTSSLSVAYTLYGKGVTGDDVSYIPSLAITTTSETLYTATFTANEGAVTPTVNIYSDSERTTPVTNGTLADATTYYYTATATGYDNYEGTFTVNGANPDVAFTMTAKAVYSYTVNATDGASTLKVLASSSDYEDETIYYHYNQYLNVSGTLYQAATDNTGVDASGYKSKFTLDEDDKVVTKTYSTTAITNVLFLAEGEDLFSRGTGSYADTRLSMGAGGYASSKTSFVTIPAGTYHLCGVSRGGNAESYYHTFTAGETEIYKTEGSGANSSFDSGEFELDGTTVMYMSGGSNNQLVDYVYIYGTPDNEIVGSVDYSTSFMGDHKDMTIAPGQTITLNFKNYGNTSQNWYNWLVRLSGTTGVDHTLRADNYVIGDDGSTVSTRSITEDDGAINWNDFVADMTDATVEMTITYSAAGAFSISATSTGSAHTYTHSFSYKDTKSGNIKVELGVEYAWLEVTSTSSTASKVSSSTLEGWKTFYNSDFNFQVDANTTIYKAASATEGTVTLTSIDDDIIPASTAVILKTSDTSTYAITLTATSDDTTGDYTGNALQVATGSESNKYILAYTDDYGLGFYEYTSTLDAGDIYLDIPVSNAKMLHFVVDGEATGVEVPAIAEVEEPEVLYNMAGQIVGKDYRGIVISNKGVKRFQK